MVKMTKILEKGFCCSILFQPNFANLLPVTAIISTAGKLSSGGPQTTFTVNHKPQSNLYDEFKWLVEVTFLYQQVGIYSVLDVIKCHLN